MSCGAYSSIQSLGKYCVAATGLVAGSTAAATAATSFFGRAITHVSFAHGFGVGLLAVPATLTAFYLFDKAGIKNMWANAALSFGAGALVTYAASATAVALGIAAAPITIPGALAITAASVGAFALSAFIAILPEIGASVVSITK